jgi:hypothetical protein
MITVYEDNPNLSEELHVLTVDYMISYVRFSFFIWISSNLFILRFIHKIFSYRHVLNSIYHNVIISFFSYWIKNYFFISNETCTFTIFNTHMLLLCKSHWWTSSTTLFSFVFWILQIVPSSLFSWFVFPGTC